MYRTLREDRKILPNVLYMKKIAYLCGRKRTNERTIPTQGVYVNVPTVDWSLFRELIRKFGWQAETREQLLDRFISSRPVNPDISEEEIMDEVRAVRYAK